jgi:hypothetical protein
MHLYRVHLVVDRSFGEGVLSLPESEPSWIIDSLANHPFIVRARENPTRQNFSTGITSFNDSEEQPEDVALRLINIIYEHHGPLSHTPPMDALRIIGAKITDELREYLIDENFSLLHGVDFDFELVKEVRTCASSGTPEAGRP